MRPDAWLLRPKGEGLMVIIEAKTRGELYQSQLARYQDKFLEGKDKSEILRVRSWTEVADLLDRESSVAALQPESRYLIREFLDYLSMSGFAHVVPREVEMEMLLEGGRAARLFTQEIPAILRRVRHRVEEEVKRRSGGWELEDSAVHELQDEQHDKTSSAYHQFYISAGGNWSIGLFSGLAQWARFGGAPFWVIVNTEASEVSAILREPDWVPLHEGKRNSWYLSQIEIPAGTPRLATDQLVSLLGEKLQEKLKWLRDQIKSQQARRKTRAK